MKLGFGAAQVGNLYRSTTDEESIAAVQAAWDGGVRYFDTAPHYGLGLSERRLGMALASYERSEFVISTKVGRILVPSPETADRTDPHFLVSASLRREWDFSRDGILRSLDSSLQRLGLDRVDIVYLHDPDDHWGQASTTGVETLAELREQHVVGAIGAGMNQSRMLTRFITDYELDLVMLAGRFTLLDQSAASDLLPLAESRGVGVVAAGIYNSGLLSESRANSNSMFNYASAPPEIIERANQIAEICESHGVTLPDVALSFPFRHPAVVSVVVGMRTVAQVEENLLRYRADIPAAVWGDLIEAGLIREGRP